MFCARSHFPLFRAVGERRLPRKAAVVFLNDRIYFTRVYTVDSTERLAATNAGGNPCCLGAYREKGAAPAIVATAAGAGPIV
jgi:hypothetical protein